MAFLCVLYDTGIAKCAWGVDLQLMPIGSAEDAGVLPEDAHASLTLSEVLLERVG
jgi:hypothetical protein